MHEPVSILGVEVDPVTLDEAVAAVIEAVDAHRHRGAAPIQVATVNPEFVMLARRDASFARALRGCALRVADGAGLIGAARLLGQRLPGRIPGVELVHAVCAAAARRGDRVFLLGAAPGVAEAAAARLRAQHPGLVVAGTFAGDSSPAGDGESVPAVRAARPDVVLVAYGAPAQELWSRRNLERAGAAVAIGVGGTFDYLAGRARRAPSWVRRAGFEWLYRLAREPWRARRQLALWQFLGLVLRQRLAGA